MKKIISKKVTAGQPGTKKMVEIYGDKLICIRYRYDMEKGIRYKSVEIVVEQGIWEKKPDKSQRNVELKINYNETDKRQMVKSAGGKWNKEKQVWELMYKKVKELGLEERIVG